MSDGSIMVQIKGCLLLSQKQKRQTYKGSCALTPVSIFLSMLSHPNPAKPKELDITITPSQ